MANTTVAAKTTGDAFTAPEVNNMVAAINSKQDAKPKRTLLSGDISAGGKVVTLTSLVDVPVNGIIIDDYIKLTGFTKNPSDDHITFTDGTTVVATQVILFL